MNEGLFLSYEYAMYMAAVALALGFISGVFSVIAAAHLLSKRSNKS